MAKNNGFEKFASILAKQFAAADWAALSAPLLSQVLGPRPTKVLGWAIAARRAGIGAAVGSFVGGVLLGSKGVAIGGGIGGVLGGYSGARQAAQVW